MSLTAEQQELATTVRAVLAKHGDSAAMRRGVRLAPFRSAHGASSSCFSRWTSTAEGNA